MRFEVKIVKRKKEKRKVVFIAVQKKSFQIDIITLVVVVVGDKDHYEYEDKCNNQYKNCNNNNYKKGINKHNKTKGEKDALG
jgi:hypothetical protein